MTSRRFGADSSSPGLDVSENSDSPCFSLHWWILLILATAVCLVVLVDRLVDFPLYFFCDEAMHGVEAQSLLSRGTDQYGDAWPLFFRGYGTFHLSLSVYLQLPFEYLLGHSEFSIRFRNVVFALWGSLGAAILVARVDRRFFASAAAPAVFTAAPFWFLHARTGFEFMLSASAWIWMVLSYDRLVQGRGRGAYGWFFVLFVSYAIAFYSYTPARGWATLTLVVMFFAYLPQHWRSKARTFFLIAGCVIIVSPFVYKAIVDPKVAFGRLQDMGVKSTEALTATRMSLAWNNFVAIISPRYWFFWNGIDIFESSERHLVPDAPMLPFFLLPFTAVGGLYVLVTSWSRPLCRALCLLVPVGAFPAVFVATNALRCIPIGISYLILGVIGIAWVSHMITNLTRLKWHWQGLAVIVLQIPVWQTYRFALVEAPKLYRNYGFYGVQVGASPVFHWIRENLKRYPVINLGNEAFNGNEVLENFYLTPKENTQLAIVETGAPCLLTRPGQKGIWILRDTTWTRFIGTSCPVSHDIIATMSDPLGRPLFYMVELAAKPSLAGWLEAREIERMKPVSSKILLRGEEREIIHTAIDGGELRFLFDGDRNSIIRSDNINPLIVRMPGFKGQKLSKVRIRVDHCVESTVEVSTLLGGESTVWGKEHQRGKDERCDFNYTRPSPTAVDELSVSVRIAGADNRVHLDEIEFE